ncbi:hypothetical protein [Neptunomonas sp.]|uniref:hypothetical protein n=1 Tax=Neptunomonas sp. TaxID=1971898 RepID=UPI0025E0EBDC|nr:hypothetical protein [Neptunomonas sp.]
MVEVNIAKFRNATDDLRSLNREFKTCASDKERQNLADSVNRKLGEYSKYSCARAKSDDIESFDRAKITLLNQLETS